MTLQVTSSLQARPTCPRGRGSALIAQQAPGPSEPCWAMLGCHSVLPPKAARRDGGGEVPTHSGAKGGPERVAPRPASKGGQDSGIGYGICRRRSGSSTVGVLTVLLVSCSASRVESKEYRTSASRNRASNQTQAGRLSRSHETQWALHRRFM